MGGWFRAKKSDGTWLQTDEQFDPTAQGYGYCEDNAYNYAFPPYDGQGLANLYGMISWMKLTRRLAQPILAPGPAIRKTGKAVMRNRARFI